MNLCCQPLFICIYAWRCKSFFPWCVLGIIISGYVCTIKQSMPVVYITHWTLSDLHKVPFRRDGWLYMVNLINKSLVATQPKYIEPYEISMHKLLYDEAASCFCAQEQFICTDPILLGGVWINDHIKHVSYLIPKIDRT